MAKHLFTSESVSEGHPDKIADQISDAVLDAILEQDPKARVACETYVKTGMVLVGGEITTSAWVDIEEITRNTVREIGYVHSDMGFDANSCAVLSAIGKQSPDINQGVDRTQVSCRCFFSPSVAEPFACQSLSQPTAEGRCRACNIRLPGRSRNSIRRLYDDRRAPWRTLSTR